MITEPSTLATDYVLGALCAALAWRLRSRRARHEPARGRGCGRSHSRRLPSAASPAAPTDGFRTVLPPKLARAIWAVTTIVVGMAACLLLSATLTAGGARTARRWLLAAVWGQFAVYAAWMLRHEAFVNVIVEYGLAMLCVAAAAPRGAEASPASRRRDG